MGNQPSSTDCAKDRQIVVTGGETTCDKTVSSSMSPMAAKIPANPFAPHNALRPQSSLPSQQSQSSHPHRSLSTDNSGGGGGGDSGENGGAARVPTAASASILVPASSSRMRQRHGPPSGEGAAESPAPEEDAAAGAVNSSAEKWRKHNFMTLVDMGRAPAPADDVGVEEERSGSEVNSAGGDSDTGGEDSWSDMDDVSGDLSLTNSRGRHSNSARGSRLRVGVGFKRSPLPTSAMSGTNSNLRLVDQHNCIFLGLSPAAQAEADLESLNSTRNTTSMRSLSEREETRGQRTCSSSRPGNWRVRGSWRDGDSGKSSPGGAGSRMLTPVGNARLEAPAHPHLERIEMADGLVVVPCAPVAPKPEGCPRRPLQLAAPSAEQASSHHAVVPTAPHGTAPQRRGRKQDTAGVAPEQAAPSAGGNAAPKA